jgi:hypothetical protein
MDKKTKDRIANIVRIALVVGVAVFLIVSAQKGEIIKPDIELNNPFENKSVETISPEDAATNAPSETQLEPPVE